MCAATVAPRDKEPLRARAELYAPTRLSTKVQRLFFTRTLVTDIIAQQCTLLVYAAARTSMPLRENALPRVGILGGGHIGCAVAVKLLKSDFPASNIAISTRQPDRVLKCDALQSPQHLALFQAVPRYYDNVRLCKESDVLVLCMPPSQLKSVSIQIKHALALPDCATLVISTLCGATLESLQKACGTRLLVKTRVNVPRLVGLLDMSHGAIGIAAEELGSTREEIHHLCDALEETGIRLGQDRVAARAQALETILGDPNIPVAPVTTASVLTPSNTAATWSEAWTNAMRTLQRALSDRIRQVEVPSSS